MTMVPTQASLATRVAHANAPISDLDPYSDEALMEPWAMYRELQGLGSAVWLTRYQMFALTRYDSVIRALKDASAFSSASGVMMNDEMNQVLRGNTLCSDGADRQRSRRIIGKPLSPTALKSLQEEITLKAEQLVERLVSKGTFCAITELATVLPMDIVATAVGLPQDGRERMLVWAAQMFNCFGPLNDRARGAFPVLREMIEGTPGAGLVGIRHEKVTLEIAVEIAEQRPLWAARPSMQPEQQRCASRRPADFDIELSITNLDPL